MDMIGAVEPMHEKGIALRISASQSAAGVIVTRLDVIEPGKATVSVRLHEYDVDRLVSLLKAAVKAQDRV